MGTSYSSVRYTQCVGRGFFLLGGNDCSWVLRRLRSGGLLSPGECAEWRAQSTTKQTVARQVEIKGPRMGQVEVHVAPLQWWEAAICARRALIEEVGVVGRARDVGGLVAALDVTQRLKV